MKPFRVLTLLALALPAIPTAALAAKEEVRNTIQIPTPPPGKGQIVWFRPGGVGPIVGCSVKENDQKISSLGTGR